MTHEQKIDEILATVRAIREHVADLDKRIDRAEASGRLAMHEARRVLAVVSRLPCANDVPAVLCPDKAGE